MLNCPAVCPMAVCMADCWEQVNDRYVEAFALLVASLTVTVPVVNPTASDLQIWFVVASALRASAFCEAKGPWTIQTVTGTEICGLNATATSPAAQSAGVVIAMGRDTVNATAS